MRILIDARLYGLENAGLGRYVINLIRELVNVDRKNEYIILLRKKYFNRLKFPGNWEKVLVDFRHYSLIEQTKLPGIIKKYNPDIVHFPHFNVPIFCGRPFVVTIHDILMHKQKGKEATTLPFYLYYLKRMGYRLIFDTAVRKAAKIIVPSKFIKKELMGYYKFKEEKLAVTYEGLDEKVVPKGKPGDLFKKYKLDSDYFLYVGNAYPHKNLKRAIEAVVFLNKTCDKKIIFAIASSRSIFTKRLERLIKNLKADKYVRLLGFVPNKDLGHLYKNSLGFVYPSLSEGFGLPGLEAIAAGTLVLASDIPVFKEVYEDRILYFNPLDFSSIEKCMEDVLKMEQEKRNEIIKRGQEFIKRYSWSKMARQTLKIYENSAGLRQN
jgi:glycosyltransferase involved in cell wall biosynthesis